MASSQSPTGAREELRAVAGEILQESRREMTAVRATARRWPSHVGEALDSLVQSRMEQIRRLPDLGSAELVRVESAMTDALARCLLGRSVVKGTSITFGEIPALWWLPIALKVAVVAAIILFGIPAFEWFRDLLPPLQSTGTVIFALVAAITLTWMTDKLTRESATGRRRRASYIAPIVISSLFALISGIVSAVPTVKAFVEKYSPVIQLPDLPVLPSIVEAAINGVDWSAALLAGMIIAVPLISLFVSLPRVIFSFVAGGLATPDDTLIVGLANMATAVDWYLRPDEYEDDRAADIPGDQDRVDWGTFTARAARHHLLKEDGLAFSSRDLLFSSQYQTRNLFRSDIITLLRRYAHLVETSWARRRRIRDRIADKQLRRHAHAIARHLRRHEEFLVLAGTSQLEELRRALTLDMVNSADGNWHLLAAPDATPNEYRVMRVWRVAKQLLAYLVLLAIIAGTLTTRYVPEEIQATVIVICLLFVVTRFLAWLDPKFADHFQFFKQLLEVLKRGT